MNITFPLHFLSVSCIAFCFLAATSLTAAEVTWTGATDTFWSEDNNWDDPGGFTDNDSILFNSLSTSNLSTNNDLTSQTVSGITVIDPANNITISGNAFTLGAGGVDLSDATRNLSISTEVTLGANQTWDVAIDRQVTVGTNDGIIALGSNTWNLSGAGTVQASQLSGTAGSIINLNGPGRLAIIPASVSLLSPNFSGTINLNNGVLQFDRADDTWGNNFVINADGGELHFSVSVGGTRTFSAALNVLVDTTINTLSGSTTKFLSGGLNIGDQTLSLISDIGSGNVHFSGAGTTLTGSPVFDIQAGRTLGLAGTAVSDGGAGHGFTVTGGGRLLFGEGTFGNFSGTLNLENGILQTGTNTRDNIFGSDLQVWQGTVTVNANTSRTFTASVTIHETWALDYAARTGNGSNQTFQGLTFMPGASLDFGGSSSANNHTALATFSSLTLSGGAADVASANPANNLDATKELRFGNNWTRENAATLHLALGDRVFVTNTNPSALASNGVLGFATFNESFAEISFGSLIEFDSYQALTSGSLTSVFSYEATGDVTVDADQTINALRIDNAASGALNLSDGTMSVLSGGVLFIGDANYTIENGQLGASNTEVIIHQRSATADLIIDADIGGGASGSLTKTGAGTLLLSTPQSFGGQTSINRGTLALTGAGSLAGDIFLHADTTLDLTGVTGGAYSVGASQTLAGFGTVDITGGTLTINGELSPGNSAGVLTVEGNLTLAGEVNMGLASNGLIAGTDFDQVVVTDLLTWGGDLVISSIDAYDLTTLASYQLFDAASYFGNFASVTVGATPLSFAGNLWSAASGGGTEYTFNIDDGVFAVVPEPSSAGLVAVGLLSLLLRRWRHLKR